MSDKKGACRKRTDIPGFDDWLDKTFTSVGNDLPLGFLWVAVLVGFWALIRVHESHNSLFSGIVALLIAIGTAAVIAGVMYLTSKVKMVWFGPNGILEMNERFSWAFEPGADPGWYASWRQVAWENIVQIELGRPIRILYSGNRFPHNLTMFDGQMSKVEMEKMKSVSETLLVAQHRGEIPGTVTIIPPQKPGFNFFKFILGSIVNILLFLLFVGFAAKMYFSG